MRKLFALVCLLLSLCAVASAQTIEAYGLTFDSEDETLDLGKTQVTDFEEFKGILDQMPNLTTVEMFSTKMEEDVMAELTERYPAIRFGWTLRAGKYRVKSDCTAFSTLRQPDETPRYGSSAYDVLTYCWQIKALDLGHNKIDDPTFVGTLTGLHYLILADNKLTDISALSNLKELEYCELFMNDITDITPLTELPNLIDLNLSRTRIEDLTPLYEMKQLKRLWISRVGNPITEEEQEALRAALPDTEIHFTANCTKEGWRQHERFTKVKNSFRLNLGQEYIPWTDEDRAL